MGTWAPRPPGPRAGHHLFTPFTVTSWGDSAQLSGRSAGTHLGAKFGPGLSRYRPGPRFEGRQGAAGRLRGPRPPASPAPRGGDHRGVPAPHAGGRHSAPSAAWPSAQRRPGSPVPTLPGRLTERAPGQGGRLRTRGERPRPVRGAGSPRRSARLPGWPPALPDRAEAPVGARSWRAGRFGVSPPSPGRK